MGRRKEIMNFAVLFLRQPLIGQQWAGPARALHPGQLAGIQPTVSGFMVSPDGSGSLTEVWTWLAVSVLRAFFSVRTCLHRFCIRKSTVLPNCNVPTNYLGTWFQHWIWVSRCGVDPDPAFVRGSQRCRVRGSTNRGNQPRLWNLRRHCWVGGSPLPHTPLCCEQQWDVSSMGE